jgi:hypothetical protein
MPKKLASDSVVFGAAPEVAPIRSWQIAALSFAACGAAMHSGVGALVAMPVVATVIWALARLHRHAPSVPSTCDLVGSTLGVRAAGTAAVVQLVAYALLAVAAARTVGLLGLSGQSDLTAAMSGWWWPALSVAAIATTGVLVWSLPTRVVAMLVAVLAAAGLLVYFYLALAVLAKVLSGTAAVQIGSPAWTSVPAGGTIIIFLGLATVAFEAPTTAADQLRSVAVPLGWSVGAAGAIAALLLVATNLGAAGGFRLDATDFGLIVPDMFGHSGFVWVIMGGAALWAAALLALTWAVLRVARRLTGEETATTMATLALLAILTVALCRNSGTSDKLVAAMLLVVLYVFVAEANSRLPGAETAARMCRVLWPVLLVVVVLFPLRDAEFAASALWPVVITALVVGIAASLSAIALRQGPPPRQPR